MPLPGPGAKARSQTIHGRSVLKKVSNDSGIASLSSSRHPRSASEERSKTPRSLTMERVAKDARPSSSLRTNPNPSSAPVEVGQSSSNAVKPRRKVRRVESWLKQQQRMNGSLDDAPRDRIVKGAGTPCNPYLAYPGMSNFTSRHGVGDDDDILGDFVIVEEEEPEEQLLGDPDSTNNLESSANGFFTTSSTSYASSARPLSLSGSRPASILSVSPWRRLTKTLPIHRYPSAPGEPVDLSTPTTSLRIGSVRRRSPIPDDFLNVDSPKQKPEKAAQNKTSSGTLRAPDTPPRHSVRKRLGNLMRPNGSSSINLASLGSTKLSNSPRPSTSASATTATTSTVVENDRHSVGGGSSKRFLPKFSLNLSKTARPPAENIRLDSPTRSSFSTTCPSEEPEELAPLPERSFSQPDLPFPPSLSKRRSQQNIFHDKRHNASSSALSALSIGTISTFASNMNGRASSVFSASSTTKRKRLVVSGIDPEDVTGIQGLRTWCERFGELRQITRMPNGDLHVDFRRADVADTVCRISARVHISGVGSVNLSWISGRRH